MRDAARLLREGILVHPHDGGEGKAGPKQQHCALVPGVHREGEIRGLDRECPGLGNLPGPLLGHTLKYLAVRILRTPGRGRIDPGAHGEKHELSGVPLGAQGEGREGLFLGLCGL